MQVASVRINHTSCFHLRLLVHAFIDTFEQMDIALLIVQDSLCHQHLLTQRIHRHIVP